MAHKKEKGRADCGGVLGAVGKAWSEETIVDIDSFALIPTLAAAGATVLILAVLVLCLVRNTAKVSFISYVALGVVAVGCLLTYFSHKVMILVLTVLALEFLFFIYALVLALGDPKKRENKKTQKELEDLIATMTTKEEVARIRAKYENSISMENDMIAKVSGFFTSEEPLPSFLATLNKLLMEKVKADGCVIMMYEESDNMLNVKSFEGKFPPPYKLPDDLPHKPARVDMNIKYGQFAPKDNLFGNIFSAGKVVNVTDPKRDNRIYQNMSEDFLQCGPYLFIPMIQDGEGVALFCLSRVYGNTPFDDVDVEAAQNIIDIAKTAFRPLNSFLSYMSHAEATKEGAVATEAQKTLLPEKFPAIAKLSLGKYTMPVESVCGDFYDVIPSRKERISFIIGDVTGKGMKSLLVMAAVRAMLRLVTNTEQNAATILEWINKAICIEQNKDHFASVALINYNSIDDTAQVATSGTNIVLLYTAATGEVKKISTDCEPVGVEKTTEYKATDLKLASGDMIIACTDGVVECLNENGAQYSTGKLESMIKKNAKLAGKDIAAKVKDDIKKFCGTTQQFDDQSLLVVKIA